MKIEQKKIGLISCSGEDMPEGTISRIATRKILEQRDDTVTICLPLFLAGGEGERRFARNNPCITVDGCDKRCAAVGVKKFGKVEPVSKILITEIIKNNGYLKPTSKSIINPQDEPLIKETMKIISKKITEFEEMKR